MVYSGSFKANSPSTHECSGSVIARYFSFLNILGFWDNSSREAFHFLEGVGLTGSDARVTTGTVVAVSGMEEKSFETLFN